MVKVYLQRHTKPDVKSQICYGVSDLALHPNYIDEHLPKVINRLNNIDAKILYSSPLKRCFTLACDIKKAKGINNITIDNRLMELNFGKWEMCNWNDIYMTKEGKAWFDDFLNTPTLDGESFSEIVERVKCFLNEIKSKGEDTIVVTHSGVIRAALVITGTTRAEDVFGYEINYGDLVELILK